MPRNGSGSFTLPAADFPAVATTLIESSKFNNVGNDISQALTDSISKNGETIPTADLPMGGKNHTNVADADLRNEYASLGQTQDQSFLWCGTAGGTANAITLSPTPGVPAYKAGQVFRFKSGASANTGAVTFAISGLAAIAGQVNFAACGGGEIIASRNYEIWIDSGLSSAQIYNADYSYPVKTGEVGVKNANYQYGDVKRYGLTGDGTTNDAANLLNAETSCSAIGEAIYFSPSPGTYKIDVTSASVTINANIKFSSGAKIVLYRTSGTNRLDIRGSLDAPNEYIFDVTNIASTIGAWNALWNQNGTNLPITFGYGASTYNQYLRVPIVLSPQLFGAVGIPGNDDTLPVQICFDMHKHTVFNTDYDVSQVTLRGTELNIDFNNKKLNGGWVSSDYSSILEIKCAYSLLKSIRVDAAKSQYYQCGVHWYTNDLNTYYVGFNRIDGMYCENCYIDLCIGGLPSQTVFAAQGAVVAAPLATNAPLSESTINGFTGITSLCNILFNQPNGKMRVTNSALGTVTTSGYSAPAVGRSTLGLSSYSTVDVRNPGSELSITASSIVTTDNTSTIPIISVSGGSLYLVNTDIEPSTQIRIKANSGVYDANGSVHAGQTYYLDSYIFIDSPANFGFNIGTNEPAIVIEDKANGMLCIDKARASFSSGYYLSRTAPFIMVTDTFSGLDANATEAEIISASTELINPYIAVRLTDLNFRDTPWKSHTNNLIGLSRGLPNTTINGLCFSGMIASDLSSPVDAPDYVYMEKGATQGSKNITMPAIDPSGKTVAAAVTTGTDGGWTVVTTGAGTVGGLNIATGPLVIGNNIYNGAIKYDWVIRMSSGASGSGAISSIESPKTPCEQSKLYFMSFFVRTNSGAPASELFAARIKSYDFDDVFLSEENAVLCYESSLSGKWQHIIAAAETDKNAAKLALYFYVENGCEVDLTCITLA